MSKITAYTALTTPAGSDVVPIVDVSDTTMAASGTTKQITLSNLLTLGVQIDATAADIQPLGSQAAGSTGKAADAGHVHASAFVQPNDVGVIAWTGDPASLGGTPGALASGKLYLSAFWIRKTVTLSNMAVAIGTAGTTLTTGQNFAGIYDSTGAQKAATADQTSTWSAGGVGTYDMALTASFSASPGMYWAALLSNATTCPNFRGANAAITLIQVGQTAAQSRCGIFSSGLTALPASFTPSSIVQTSAFLHAVVLH